MDKHHLDLLEKLFLKKEKDYIKRIPKVELHAHLNGSISQTTFEKLKNMKKKKGTYISSLDIGSHRFYTNTLSGCFSMFDVIHELADNLEAIYMITCDVIKDFYNDGVYYLELRTTPKDGTDMTQRTYVETVLKAIKTTVAELNNKISVKLLLSIDRKRSVQDAEETLKLVIEYALSSEYVVGLDFSGSPYHDHVTDFLPLLEHAKKSGLKLAVHIAEVPEIEDDVTDLLQLRPDRLGHGTFLHPNAGGTQENFDLLKEMQIPLEVCLSSNILSQTVRSFDRHHFKWFREMDYPCTLATDDKGIFNTSLSKEYYLASHFYRISKDGLFDLSYKSIDYIFSSNNEKLELQRIWKTEKELYFNSLEPLY